MSKTKLTRAEKKEWKKIQKEVMKIVKTTNGVIRIEQIGLCPFCKSPDTDTINNKDEQDEKLGHILIHEHRCEHCDGYSEEVYAIYDKGLKEFKDFHNIFSDDIFDVVETYPDYYYFFTYLFTQYWDKPEVK